MLLDFVFETAIVISLVIFISGAFLTLDQAAFEYVLYLTTLTALGIYLLLSVGRQIAAAFFQGGGASVVLSVPLPIEEEKDSSWIKRMYYSLKAKYGIVGFIVLVAGVIQFFDYLYRMIKWLWETIF